MVTLRLRLASLKLLLTALWQFLAALWSLLGRSWSLLGRSWGTLGPLLAFLGLLLASLGLLLGLSSPPLATLGPLLATLGPLLSRSWPLFGRSWPLLDRFRATKNALKAFFVQINGPLSLQASEHPGLQVASAGAAKRKQFTSGSEADENGCFTSSRRAAGQDHGMENANRPKDSPNGSSTSGT